MTTCISSDKPVVVLAPGRWRVSMVFTHNKVGTVYLIAGSKTLLDVQVHEFVRDHIVTHSGGPMMIITVPRIPGRSPPSVSLQLTQAT